ncbi:hypothetical protein LEN26_014655 [Aphanomyces euteiches]|nr:hypothetical protein LEN26_014655 [Aphanomyces euteiches]KAH9112677.1 hypothetical protein AeMF1_013024 [Aphanomyces euteiches]KAH9181982.1 hypothetical protein AeNC1_016042 [Aphanomyces euteiches]
MEMRAFNEKIGGVGSVVEIDETSLKKKSKYGRGTQHDGRWLSGGVDRTTTVLVNNDRTKRTLMPIIEKHIAEATTIMSDKFASHVSTNERHTFANTPSHMRYTHMWVNHSNNFVNPDNGGHTKQIQEV